MNTVSDKVETVAQIVRDILKIEGKYKARALQLDAEGVFKEKEERTLVESARREAYREEMYQQLSKDEGGLAAKAARLTKDQWEDLTGKERKEYQAARDNVKQMVDNRMSRMKKAAAAYKEEDARKAAAEGQPTQGRVINDAMDRWAAFDVNQIKANKKYQWVNPERLADLHRRYRDELSAMMAEQKL